MAETEAQKEQAAVEKAVTPSGDRVTPANPQIAKDRKIEDDRNKAVVDAVHDATHDKKGNPIPLPQPPGITVVEGRP